MEINANEQFEVVFYIFFRLSGEGYRLFHTTKLWGMFNTVVKQHRQHNNVPCDGDLSFDYSKEEKWGCCWRERVKCDSCSYVSPMFKLYEEVNSGKRGQKAATANVGLSIGLAQTSSGPSSIVKLYASCNIPPPTRQGLQKRANAVSKIIEETNESDMKARRQQLKTINKFRNRPEHEIHIQADGQYNNNLYSGVGKTPFQPATQCTYTVAENMTEKKQIIALETVNKLCSKHGFHSMEDETCDIKSGNCSATASMETSIGDEEQWAKNCLKVLKKDGLEAKYIVTDPDTAAHSAADKLFLEGATNTRPLHQIDTRHLSQNHRKFIRNSESVLAMMPGYLQAYRMVLRNRFAVDLSTRCSAEYTCIYTAERGDFEKIKPRISRCRVAIKHCYSGDHSRCRTNSSVCKGEINDNWLVKSAFLNKNFKINLANESNEQSITDCIDYRLGDDMLHKTKLNLNSQKVEATNRAIRMCLPKNVTFSRNFVGRAHSAIHNVNNGMGASIRKLCAAAGCPIVDGSRVAKSLMALQFFAENKRKRERSLLFKIKRKLRRVRLYGIYEKHTEKKKYIQAQLLKERKARDIKRLTPRTRAQPAAAAASSDHIYSRTRSRTKKRPIKGRQGHDSDDKHHLSDTEVVPY